MTVTSAWKVRALLNASRAARKRQRIGDVEFVCDEKEDPDPAKDSKTYIALHQVLMVAYARAGVKPIDPAPATPERASSHTTDFVQIPLDVAMAYHFRLVKSASSMPFSNSTMTRGGTMFAIRLVLSPSSYALVTTSFILHLK